MNKFDDPILISIVVPIYNSEKYLKKCIESIINQSYPRLEIILVDDGSTDESPVICDRYMQKDKRIKVIHKKNGGLVSSRKVGVKEANGEYIVYVDGDDWIEKDRISRVVSNIIKYRADMIYMSGHIKEFKDYQTKVKEEVDETVYVGKQILDILFPKIINTNKCFECKILCTLWGWAIKTELIQKKQILVDERLFIGEDYTSVWLCLLQAESVSVIKESGYHYVQHIESISHRLSKYDSYKLKIWYQELKRCLVLEDVPNIIMKVLDFTAIRFFMMADYSLLLKDNANYLFPFRKVKRYSRIVVYGAGRVGYNLIKALENSKEYEIIGLIDKNVKEFPIIKFQVKDISELSKMEYDYIVIAISDEDIAKRAKEALKNIGVEEDKIALMDLSAITEDAIPQSFKSDI